MDDKQACWLLFLYWYRQNFLLPKSEKTLHVDFSYADRLLMARHYRNAFFWNGLIHSGLFYVVYYWGFRYPIKEVQAVPGLLRGLATVTLLPLSMYLRFQDLFYDERIVALARAHEDVVHS